MRNFALAAAFGMLAPLALTATATASDVYGLKNSTSALPTVIERRGRGADDPAGDDRGDHGAGHPVKASEPMTLARRGRGADDPAGDDRGDHGAGHPVKAPAVEITTA